MKWDRVLVFAPHLDDAEFGVGGLLAARHRLGIEKAVVSVLSLDPYVRTDGVYLEDNDARLAEGVRAAALLGYALRLDREFRENDPRVDYGAFVGALERIIDDENPTAVLGPLPSFNQDHRLVHEAFVTALRPTGRFGIDAMLYEYPGAMTTEPRLYVQITPVEMEAKLEALRGYEQQSFGGHVSPDGAAALAALRGSECGTLWAETLTPLRWIERIES